MEQDQERRVRLAVADALAQVVPRAPALFGQHQHPQPPPQFGQQQQQQQPPPQPPPPAGQLQPSQQVQQPSHSSMYGQPPMAYGHMSPMYSQQPMMYGQPSPVFSQQPMMQRPPMYNQQPHMYGQQPHVYGQQPHVRSAAPPIRAAACTSHPIARRDRTATELGVHPATRHDSHPRAATARMPQQGQGGGTGRQVPNRGRAAAQRPDDGPAQPQGCRLPDWILPEYAWFRTTLGSLACKHAGRQKPYDRLGLRRLKYSAEHVQLIYICI